MYKRQVRNTVYSPVDRGDRTHRIADEESKTDGDDALENTNTPAIGPLPKTKMMMMRDTSL
jgi:hypothetical protein